MVRFEPLSIVTFFWKGWRPVYGAAHVNALARMLRARLSVPYRLLCITDDPTGITECDFAPLWDAPEIEQARRQNSYVRLKLFDPATQERLGLGSRIAAIDLDAVILRDLSPLFAMGKRFCAVRGVSAHVNGSMFVLARGSHSHVWRDFDSIESPRQIARTMHNNKRICGSDQAWLSIKIPLAQTWGTEHGVWQFERLAVPKYRDNARVVFFAGATKPWDAACREKTPELYETYMRFFNK